MLSMTDVPLWAQIILDGPVSSTEQPHSTQGCANSCLVLLAHGSKDPRWREPFERIFLKVRRKSKLVKLAYMEFTGPTLFEVAEECANEGVLECRVLPLFMASGAHLARDIPEQIEEIRAVHPEVRIGLLAPIGEDPRVTSLLKQIICEQTEQI